MGEQCGGGYSIGVTSVIETKNYVQVNIESSLPGVECPIDAVHTYPYCLVTIPKISKEIIFSETVSISSI
ncbi:MAG: protease complex subunit PrcB family protein [bacterium]